MNPRDGAEEQIKALTDTLIGMSRRIHSNPELGFEEEQACQWLSEALADAGFSVERGICIYTTLHK